MFKKKILVDLPWVTECELHAEVVATDEHAAVQTDLHHRVGLHGPANADQSVHRVTVGATSSRSHLQSSRTLHKLQKKKELHQQM